MNANTLILISKSDLEEVIHEAAQNAVKQLNEHWVKSKGNNDNPMTTEEAASFLDIKVNTLYTKVSNREITACKKGNKLYFFRADLVNYVSKGRRASGDETEESIGDLMKTPKGMTNNH